VSFVQLSWLGVDLMQNGDTWAQSTSGEFITEPFFLF